MNQKEITEQAVNRVLQYRKKHNAIRKAALQIFCLTMAMANAFVSVIMAHLIHWAWALTLPCYAAVAVFCANELHKSVKEARNE